MCTATWQRCACITHSIFTAKAVSGQQPQTEVRSFFVGFSWNISLFFCWLVGARSLGYVWNFLFQPPWRYLSRVGVVSSLEVANLEVVEEGVLVSSALQGRLLEGDGEVPFCCGITRRQPHQIVALHWEHHCC